MYKNIDLILVNSFAPRHRIASDAALENGLAVIRTYLVDRGFNVYVVDEQRFASQFGMDPRNPHANDLFKAV